MATAYVKKLAGLTRTEKLLMFVLADYHNTAQRCSWPSLPLLAEESLMSERTASRILETLEKKGLLSRIMGLGRGKTTIYLFTVLDGHRKDDTVSTFSKAEKVTKKVTNQAVKGDKSTHAIRKEQDLEPILTLPPGFLARNSREKQDRIEAAKKRGMA